MDLAYVDKLAKDNNGVKYLLIRQDLFNRTMDAKGMKAKDAKETVRAFLTMITKKDRPKKVWVDKGTEFAGELKKLCKAEGIQLYSKNEWDQGCICWTYNTITEKYTLLLRGRQWVQVHSQIDSICHNNKF